MINRTDGSVDSTTEASPHGPEWLERLLADPIAARLLGKKADLFAAKWRNCFGYVATAESMRWYILPFSTRGLLGNFSWVNVKSLIWPAIFAAYWFGYRKIYWATFALFVVWFILLFVPPKWQTVVSVGVVVFGLTYAPGIYLCHIRDAVAEIKALPDQRRVDALVARRGGTSILALILVVIAFGTVAAFTQVDLDVDSTSVQNVFARIAQSPEISSCNDREVKHLLIQGTVDKYRSMANQLLGLMKNGPYGNGRDYDLMVQTIATLRATVEDVSQVEYDQSNDIRVCQGSFKYTTEGNLQTLQYLTLIATALASGRDLPSLCSRDVTYQIRRLLDKPSQIQVQWQCD
jgi:hypothetical protein